MDGVVVIIRDSDEYLMIQDADGPFEGQWSPVHGSLEEGETQEEAARREVNEEVNLRVELESEDKMAKTPADYKTDDLHWYLTEDYKGEIELNDEISRYKWLNYDQIQEKDLLPQAEKFFEEYEEKLDV